MKRRPAFFWLHRLRPLALAVALALGAGLQAQDIIVSPPQPLRASTDPMPSTFTRMHPAFPDELRTLAEPGYVIALRYFSAKREYLDLKVQGTHLWFQRAVQDSTGRWIMNPAKKGRKEVDAHLWASVIFNPKSAAEKIPDATPRLLAVAPIFLPKTPVRSEAFVVRVTLALDATGVITAITPAKPLEASVDTAVRAGLAKFKFAPARAAGKPVAATLALPVLCQPIDADFLKRTPPRPLSRPSDGYPPEYAQSGLRAEVVIDFDVDATGAVRNPVVSTSTHPGFDATALSSIRQWKYEPATVAGKPVAVEGLRARFRYDTPGGGRNRYEFRDVTDQSKLPPPLRYDTAAVLIGAVAPVYPYALRRDGVSGRATVAVAIDTRGRVGSLKIISADRPEFGRALAAALENFTFDPALRDGQPVPQLLHFEQRFEPTEVVFDTTPDLLVLERTHPERIVSAAVLDHPLQPVVRRAPRFPVLPPTGPTQGEARVAMLIDGEGRVRLPRLVSASDDAFGYAALQAVSMWQFERPLKDGKTVVTRAEVPFTFTTPVPEPAEAPGI